MNPFQSSSQCTGQDGEAWGEALQGEWMVSSTVCSFCPSVDVLVFCLSEKFLFPSQETHKVPFSNGSLLNNVTH